MSVKQLEEDHWPLIQTLYGSQTTVDYNDVDCWLTFLLEQLFYLYIFQHSFGHNLAVGAKY